MPPHTLQGSDAFKIEVVPPPDLTFGPGDIIMGHLMRKSHIVTPSATVVISLEGRSKVKITRRTGQSRTVYRDRWQILDLRTTLYQGPLNLAEGSNEPLTWPFSLQIPFEPMPLNVNYNAKGSFLPQDPSHPINHMLPGSFHGTDNSIFGSLDSHSFVEYFLKAELHYERGGNHHDDGAICPITMRHSIPATQQLGLSRTIIAKNYISSPRLLPGREKADLSFKQHAQKFFHTSKVPRFAYIVRLTVPATIRMSDPTPLPLSLEIVQEAERTSDSIKEVAQTIEILEFHATLRSHTNDRALSDVFSIQQSNSYNDKTPLNMHTLLSKLESPLVITTGKTNEPIHFGNRLQLTLGPYGLRSGGENVQTTCGPRISPDVTTHNIRHYHRIDWKIKLQIARETETHSLNSEVQIFG